MENISWDDLRVLLAVHRAGSLLAAGKLLGLSTSTTGRRLDALESAAQCKLVHRTQTGTQLAAAALPLVRLAEGLEHGLHAQRRNTQSFTGTIRISVPDGLAPLMTRALLPFAREHPSTDIELIGENRMAEVSRREADIALRLVRTKSNVLIERQIALLRFSLFASSDYVRRYLQTHSLRRGEASMHTFIGLDTRWKNLPQEQWMTALGATRFAFRSSSMEAIIEAVCDGIGIAALPQRDPRRAGLVEIGAHIPGPTQPLFLVYHRDLRKALHVRAAIASIEDLFRMLR